MGRHSPSPAGCFRDLSFAVLVRCLRPSAWSLSVAAAVLRPANGKGASTGGQKRSPAVMPIVQGDQSLAILQRTHFLLS